MPAIDPPPPSSPSQLSLLRRALYFLAILAALIATWELYKVAWRGLGWSTPVRPTNDSMPHTWDMVDALFSPARRGGEDILLVILLRAAWFTLREALVGFLIGAVVGLVLALVFARSPLVERGFMPFVIASQTIPLIAIAPMIVIWGSQRDLPRWMMVSIIAAYLTFFPVVINTLRGLRSPPATSVELMRSYAAKPRQVLWKLQLPAAIPYMFTAFRIAATASVIGAIIGELPSGLGDGLGRALLNFMYFYISGPEKLYAAIIVSAFVGIAFVGVVVLVERLVVPPTRRVES
jgi:NitT/TauT family transport system permease protein